MPVRQNRRAFVRSMGLLPLALARAGPVDASTRSGRLRFGPLEWAWRSLTWLRVEPFPARAAGPA